MSQSRNHPAIGLLLERGRTAFPEPEKGPVATTPVASEILSGKPGEAFRLRVFRGRPGEPHVLLFGAEFDAEAEILHLAEGLGQLGCTLVVVDYLGAGEGAQETSDLSVLYERAEAAYAAFLRWLTEDEERSGPVILMGRSFGTTLAIDIAARHGEETLALILESAFDKPEDFFRGVGVDLENLPAMEPDPFAHRTKMQAYKKPVLFLHSQRDQVVSLYQVEWLVVESRSKATQFQIMAGENRRDLMWSSGEYYFATIQAFVDKRLGRRPTHRSWRQGPGTREGA